MAKERVRCGLRLDYELNTKLIEIARYEDVSKNKLIVRELRRMVREFENAHTGKE